MSHNEFEFHLCCFISSSYFSCWIYHSLFKSSIVVCLDNIQVLDINKYTNISIPISITHINEANINSYMWAFLWQPVFISPEKINTQVEFPCPEKTEFVMISSFSSKAFDPYRWNACVESIFMTSEDIHLNNFKAEDVSCESQTFSDKKKWG